MMAEHLDYVSAMVYPSHWAPGEYGVARPERAAVRHRPALARGLPEGRPRHRRARRPVAPGLLARRRLRPGPGRRGDRRRPRRGHRRVPALGPGGHLHGRRAPDRRRERPSFPKTANAATVAKSMKPDELGVVPVLMHHQIRPNGSALRPDRRRSSAASWRGSGATASTRCARRASSPGSWTSRRARRRSCSPSTTRPTTRSASCRTARSTRTPALGDARGLRDAASRLPGDGDVLRPAERLRGERPARPGKTLRWLVEHGFELGNHTKDHIALNTLDSTEVQRQLVLGDRVLSDRLPGYRAADDGAAARRAAPPRARSPSRARWDGQSYRFAGVFLAGAEPTPSPFSTKWDPAAIPRIRTNPNWNGTRDFTGGMWLDILERNPGCATSRTATRRRSRSRRPGRRARAAVPLAANPY